MSELMSVGNQITHQINLVEMSTSGRAVMAQSSFAEESQPGFTEMPPRCRELHTRALAFVARYQAAEIDLLEILNEVESARVHLRFGCNSLFQYAVKCLGLSENIAYTFIYVARKAREVPALASEIAQGKLSVSKAKKISGVLTSENSAQWIALAKRASQQKLEREVALASPREAGRGRMNYVHPQNEIAEKVIVTNVSGPKPAARVQVQVGISERLMIKIRRAQDLQSQKSRRFVGLEQTLEAMVDHYLAKHDPLAVAKRQLLRGKLKSSPEAGGVRDGDGVRDGGGVSVRDGDGVRVGDSDSGGDRVDKTTAEKMGDQQVLRLVADTLASGGIQPRIGKPTKMRTRLRTAVKRRPLAAMVKHRVILKFQGRCSHVSALGVRCQETKFLEIHHVKPLHWGGSDDFENLTLLCSGHHRGKHLD